MYIIKIILLNIHNAIHRISNKSQLWFEYFEV